MSNAKYSVTMKDAKAICLALVEKSMHAPSFEQVEAELSRLRYQNPSRCVAEFLTIASRDLGHHQFVAGIASRMASQYRDIRGNVRTLVGTLDNLREDHGVPGE